MEIKTTAISANRLTARENVQFLQEGDIIVPDNKPDIEKDIEDFRKCRNRQYKYC